MLNQTEERAQYWEWEANRMRKAIERWVHRYGNERCHEEDSRLARAIDTKLFDRQRTKDFKMSASEFRKQCHRYIARECRAGRLIDDRKK